MDNGDEDQCNAQSALIFCFDTDDKVQPCILSSVLNPTRHKPQLGFCKSRVFQHNSKLCFWISDIHAACRVYNSEGGSGGRTRHIFHSQVCMTLAREDLENG